MTIDEAIENEKRRAESCKGHYDRFVQMEAKEHEQIVEWLEELKGLRNITASHLYAVAFNRGYLKAEKEVRNKAIDDFVKEISESNKGHWRPTKYEHGEVVSETMSYDIGTIRLIAEQLKAGEQNE